ncbi:DMT family transporter [Pseudonocardia sp. MH-G8]|uniref:DMT family transporter n=1 Tax=Pseudonocardia sp. MH-G8 TaxID=1854588 RepID=UPI000BA16F5C|nr:DMT family transporter [Pseudonocardia sp. MH-G8]OZM78905.1 EamA family transporter [Pseudonocardia sp. MH-G8]
MSLAQRRSDATATSAFVAVGLGAASMSASSVLISLAGVDSATAAFYRCFLAAVVLIPLVLAEIRRHGRLPAGLTGTALVAGVFLGVDFLMWNVSIGDIGAGIATVVVNLQIVLFPVLVGLVSRTRISRYFLLALPVLTVGVALAGGALGGGAGGPGGDPVRGTVLCALAAVAYTGYLFLNRRSGRHSPAHLATPVFLSTTAAAATAGVAGVATTGIAVDLPAITWLWLALLAVFGQVVSWLLVARGLPRIEPAWASTLLLLQPVGAVVLAAAVLGQVPTATQLGGCALILLTIWLLAVGPGRRGPGSAAWGRLRTGSGRPRRAPAA